MPSILCSNARPPVAQLVRASDRNSEDPGLNPGWNSMSFSALFLYFYVVVRTSYDCDSCTSTTLLLHGTMIATEWTCEDVQLHVTNLVYSTSPCRVCCMGLERLANHSCYCFCFISEFRIFTESIIPWVKKFFSCSGYQLSKYFLSQAVQHTHNASKRVTRDDGHY